MEQEPLVGHAVGRVIGTEDATPLEFWVGVAPDQYLQLDDVVALERTPPGAAEPVRIYGVVSQVRARHEGARFDSDVFLIEDGVLPAEVAEAAKVLATRFEPEVFVPPLPGQAVRKAVDDDRDEALFFDQMRRRLPAGLTRDGQPMFVDLDFLDGTRGAHVNISGISGVATKTTYATFLLHSLFTSGVLGAAHNTKALIFNVKGEDLLFLDHANVDLGDDQPCRYEALGLPAGAFGSVAMFAPPVRDDPNASPDVAARQRDVTSFFWTIEQFCTEELLPFLFADAEDDRQQYTMVVHNVTAKLLRHAEAVGDGGVGIDGRVVRTFDDLVELIEDKVDLDGPDQWGGRAIGAGTINGLMYIMSLYFQDPATLGMSAFEAGLATLPATAGLVVATPFIPKLAAKYGSRIVILIGFVAMTGGFVLFLGTDVSWEYGAFIIPIVAVFVFRVLDEEKMLEQELDGYHEYVQQTRYRLVPFVW